MKLKEQTIRRMAHRGEIPSRKIGKVLRFSPVEIERWVEANRKGERAGGTEGVLFCETNGNGETPEVLNAAGENGGGE